jgi:hypothetical protein
MDHLPDKRLASHVYTWLLASRIRLRAQRAGAAIAAQHLLDKRETDPKHVGEGTLGARPPLVGLHNLLT